MNRWLWAWCAVALVLPNVAAAVPGFPAVSVSTEADGTQTYSLGLQVLALMTGLTLLPAALIMMTAFTSVNLSSTSAMFAVSEATASFNNST